jgi:hypothetical protein
MSWPNPAALVCRADVRRGLHSYRCQNEAKKDGYCLVHHPERQRQRQAKREAKIEAWRASCAAEARTKLYAERYAFLREQGARQFNITPEQYDEGVERAMREEGR